ncbi:Bacterial extracellular solute-binding protein [Acididesulfobacillus acetoxydans]|uniref:Bacterial extracellular solute-binding protein n=1 Tax=Acididesulfobacillus acetoxydans TaxID=1561005 RepID=A0A8S0XBP5_9FIRM|nr:maltose ABC transporter substrate-binding protein [Acididesulfobacillus acetoxydans]CAA7601476.1 Bacterial extracellular solute-binding protein [Acididesulfobacillus acetoxydans]CEJ06131.1 Maltose-binding periplasmic protein [Acididesulfobacillus acetoxydans]
MSKSKTKALAGIVALILALTTLLSGCGSGKAPTPTSAASGSQVTLNLWEQMEQPVGKAFDAQMKIFEQENPGIKVNRVHYQTEDLRSQFQTAVLSGKGPELIYGPNDNMGPLSLGKLIIPLNQFMGQDFWKKFDPGILDTVKIGNDIWAVPIVNGNNLSLLYNKKLVSKAPQSFNDIIALAKKYNDGKTYAMVTNENEPYWFVPFLGAFGGKVFDSSGKITVDTPAMVSAFKYLHDLKYVYKVMPKQESQQVAEGLFKEGKAATLIDGAWCFSDMHKTLGENLGITLFPKVDDTGNYGSPYYGSTGFSVSANVKDPKVKDAIKKFFEFVTSKGFQVNFAQQMGQMPSTTEALKDSSITSDPFIKMSIEQMKHGTPMPIRAEMRAVWDAMRPELEAVMANQKTPGQAAKDMQTKAEQLAKDLTKK